MLMNIGNDVHPVVTIRCIYFNVNEITFINLIEFTFFGYILRIKHRLTFNSKVSILTNSTIAAMYKCNDYEAVYILCTNHNGFAIFASNPKLSTSY